MLVINCGSATIKAKLYRLTVKRIVDSLPARPDGIAHRVVHGGERFKTSTLVKESTLWLL